MITFNTFKRALAPAVAGSMLALALLAGGARPAPVGAEPPPQDPPHATMSQSAALFPPGPSSPALFPPGPYATPPVDCGIIVQDGTGDDCDAVQAGIIVQG